ncbi:MAG: hypothetical protein ACT4OK_11090 [Gemmobacter sp.]
MKHHPVELPEHLRAEGVVRYELFALEVPVYTSEKTRVDAMGFLGLPDVGLPQPCLGCVSRLQDENGAAVFSMTITPEASLSTWAHEAVHLADLVMEERGIPTGADNTEVRAYLTGYAVQQIREIMEGYEKRMAKVKTRAKKGKTNAQS